MKTRISESECMQLVGLLTVAQQHARRIGEVRSSICELMSIDRTDGDSSDHVMDVIYGSNLADPVASAFELLENLQVTRHDRGRE